MSNYKSYIIHEVSLKSNSHDAQYDPIDMLFLDKQICF